MISHVSFSSQGGAGLVAARLSEAQRESGLQSEFVACTDSNLKKRPLDDLRITLAAAADNYVLVNGSSQFSITRSRFSRLPIERLEGADIVHLHWVEGVLNTHSLEDIVHSGKKVVWTLHDMRPFTGGCHYSYSCNLYTSGCRDCPETKNFVGKRLIETNYWSRLKSTLAGKMTFVAPSNWMKMQFENSPFSNVFDVNLIHNPGFSQVDERKIDRSSLPERPMFFASAADWSDPRKGLDDLLFAWEKARIGDRSTLKIAGQVPKNALRPDGVSFIGFLTLSELESAQLASDVTILPSHAENASLVIAEGRSLGKPLIVRSGTGSEEFVRDFHDGRIFSDLDSLVSAMQWSVDKENLAALRSKSAQHMRNFSPQKIAEDYSRLYGSLS